MNHGIGAAPKNIEVYHDIIECLVGVLEAKGTKNSIKSIHRRDGFRFPGALEYVMNDYIK